MRLRDKVVIVTGSTTGIGEAIARRVVMEGGYVVVHGLEEDLGSALIERLADARSEKEACTRVADFLAPIREAMDNRTS